MLFIYPISYQGIHVILNEFFKQEIYRIQSKEKDIQMETKHKQTSSSIHYFVSENSGVKSKGTILFIHPAFTNHQAFDEQIGYFSNEYKVITMDLLGHGLSQ